MTNYIVAVSLILVMMVGWIVVQQVARWYAKRHPEFGPAREEGAGCGGNCRCKGGSTCARDGQS